MACDANWGTTSFAALRRGGPLNALIRFQPPGTAGYHRIIQLLIHNNHLIIRAVAIMSRLKPPNAAHHHP
jgi:hypothetical protein